MATRKIFNQSTHDQVVHAAGQIYFNHGKYAWTNPDGEKNKSWGDQYIDVIAAEKPGGSAAWVIEIETEDSVSDSEAKAQWINYDKVFTKHWHLAVPANSKTNAIALLRSNGIKHCSVITWRQRQDGSCTFWGLPGI